MSFAMKFSNRFAALDEDGSVRPVAPAIAVAASAAAPSSADAARVALSSGDSAYRPPHSIFRRGNATADQPVHTAFQGMRGTPAEGSDWKYQRAPGYKGLFSKAEAAPPPKTYEEEYPTLGGSKTKSASSSTLPKSGYASLAKSWADKTAEEKAAADAAAAMIAKEQERRRYEIERNSNLYSALAFRRRPVIQEDNFDYNEEYAHQNGLNEPDDDYPPQGRSTTPPYYPCDFPDAREPYEEDEN